MEFERYQFVGFHQWPHVRAEYLRHNPLDGDFVHMDTRLVSQNSQCDIINIWSMGRRSANESIVVVASQPMQAGILGYSVISTSGSARILRLLIRSADAHRFFSCLSYRARPGDGSLWEVRAGFAADQRENFVPADEEPELKLKMYALEGKESVHVVFSSGSMIQNQQQVFRWEGGYFWFDLKDQDSSTAEKILDAVKDGTLFKLKLRVSGDAADFNSVVVLNTDFRQYLIRVQTNADNFDERPSVNPREGNCPFASRMLKHGLMIAMRDEVSLLAAAISTEQYFGIRAFDGVFQSYKQFCDLMIGKKRVASSVDGVCETAANLMENNHEAGDIRRLHGHTFGGDESGPFETTLDQLRAMEDAIAYTRCCDGTLKILCFPNSQNEISIFYAGKRYPMRLEQVREAALSFCEVGVGTVANGMEVICVNKYLNGDISYCVPVESKFDESDINEFMVVCGHQLFPVEKS